MVIDNFLLVLIISAVIGGVVGYCACWFIQVRGKGDDEEGGVGWKPEIAPSHDYPHVVKPHLPVPLPLSPYTSVQNLIRMTMDKPWIKGTHTYWNLKELLTKLKNMDPERINEYQQYFEPYIGHFIRFLSASSVWTNGQEKAQLLGRAHTNLDALNGAAVPVICILSFYQEDNKIDLQIYPGLTFGEALLTVFTREELELTNWNWDYEYSSNRGGVISRGSTHQPCDTCQDD